MATLGTAVFVCRFLVGTAVMRVARENACVGWISDVISTLVDAGCDIAEDAGEEGGVLEIVDNDDVVFDSATVVDGDTDARPVDPSELQAPSIPAPKAEMSTAETGRARIAPA